MSGALNPWAELVVEAAARLTAPERERLERAAVHVSTRNEARIAVVAAGLPTLKIDLADPVPSRGRS